MPCTLKAVTGIDLVIFGPMNYFLATDGQTEGDAEETMPRIDY